MSGAGYVGLVLHAHLPYVRHPEHARSIEERWLFEAIWESYLPLIEMLDRFAQGGIAAPFTLSLSPPLLAMLGDDLLGRRFDAHLARLQQLADREVRRRDGADAFAAVARFYRSRLADARRGWEATGGRLVDALVAHAAAGRVELWTSTASHAFLPGLLEVPASIRAQLRLGLRAFEVTARQAARGLWLPECGYNPRLSAELAASGVRVSVVDAHGLCGAHPPPPRGIRAPVVSETGVTWFGRDVEASHAVWSRRHGYPGHPMYRDFYRDIGFELPIELLDGEVGPHGTRLATGLKYHRITDQAADDKAPYEPHAARRLAGEHAAAFVRDRRQALSRSSAADDAPPIVVAPYDAELFGHWWFEGPTFLEATLRLLHDSARQGGPAAVGLAGYLDLHPARTRAEPAESTWGEGGHGDVWTGETTAALWRHVHHAARDVENALAVARDSKGERGRALDQAIRELLLLQASDWGFMLHGGDMAPYAAARVRAHHARATRLSRLAIGAAPVEPESVAWCRAVAAANRFLDQLGSEDLRSAFGGPPAPS